MHASGNIICKDKVSAYYFYSLLQQSPGGNVAIGSEQSVLYLHSKHKMLAMSLVLLGNPNKYVYTKMLAMSMLAQH